MLPNATPAVERALEAAVQWARRQQQPAIFPEHLLQGLLEEEEGMAARLLIDAGCDFKAARRALGLHDPIPAIPLESAGLPFGLPTTPVFERAREFAHNFSVDKAVTSEQLLLALMSEDKVLRGQLEEFGLVFSQLETSIMAAQAPLLRLEDPLELAETPEQIDSARILDASINRARESLRVIEDYCRFVLDDAHLTGELKHLRHDLTTVLRTLPPSILLDARDTPHDVGTDITTAGELERKSLTNVVQANLKRLQESLRSLEEYGKLQTANMGKAFGKLRYRAYILERAILGNASAQQRLLHAQLYLLISGSSCAASLDWTIKEAAAGGVNIIQLREKHLTDRELLDRARKVKRWTREAGVVFIMNDRPDIARLAEADGVHLGQDELSVKEARRILGPGSIVGVSTHNLDQVHQAVRQGASYIGVGPTFTSNTKKFAHFPGLDFVRDVANATSLPAFVIGGVTPKNVGQIVAAGGRRIAVSHAIGQADDPRQVATALRCALQGH